MQLGRQHITLCTIACFFFGKDISKSKNTCQSKNGTRSTVHKVACANQIIRFIECTNCTIVAFPDITIFVQASLVLFFRKFNFPPIIAILLKKDRFKTLISLRQNFTNMKPHNRVSKQQSLNNEGASTCDPFLVHYNESLKKLDVRFFLFQMSTLCVQDVT